MLARAAGQGRLVKLFLHITADQHMRRFGDRLANPLERWKLSYEDFRNRGAGRNARRGSWT
jgi:polyphosphate kinase 2 (PPK2 family)